LRSQKRTSSAFNDNSPFDVRWRIPETVRRHLDATDPRDYIYGMLGLTGMDLTPRSKAISRDVFIEYASLALSQRILVPEVLSLAGVRASREKARLALNLPSWVPNWSDLKDLAPGLQHMSRFNAGWGGKYDPPLVRRGLLRAKGVVCGKIKSAVKGNAMTLFDLVKGILQGTILRNESRKWRMPALNEFLRLYIQDLDSGSRDATQSIGLGDHKLLSIYACALLHYAIYTGVTEQIDIDEYSELAAELGLRPEHDFDDSFQTLLFSSTGANLDIFAEPGSKTKSMSSHENHVNGAGSMDGSYNGGSDGEISSLDDFIEIGKQWSHLIGFLHMDNEKRSFFRTDDGWMGVTAGEVRSGDILYVMLGCDVPVIIRKSGEGRHLFVGTCMVIGCMGGEIVKEAIRGKREFYALEIH